MAQRIASPDPLGAVEVRTDIGPLLLSADDQVVTPYMQYHGAWEPEESTAIRELAHAGMTVVDVGAHCGYFTLLLAKLVDVTGSVVAVEPDPRNHALLCANLQRAGVHNVRVVRAAACNRSGVASLSLSQENTGDHRAYEWDSGRRTIQVDGLALDDLEPPLETLDLVKLDTQATEHLAIAGMERTLARFDPTMLVEFWPLGLRELGDPPADVLDYYRQLGYEITMLGEPRVRSDAHPDHMVDAAERHQDGFCSLVLSRGR
ncbi:MAG: FkbM family methyltransferase [Actinomycetota bacterium]|nr:FkbM family methyltransferase [Actinomycetota bacterium]